MTANDIYWTMMTAMQYGGSFYQALGTAGTKADPSNQKRILDAFPELATTYGPASRFHKQLREAS
jgi:hypothetical protein